MAQWRCAGENDLLGALGTNQPRQDYDHDPGTELELRLAENCVLGGVLPPPASAAAQDINAP